MIKKFIITFVYIAALILISGPSPCLSQEKNHGELKDSKLKTDGVNHNKEDEKNEHSSRLTDRHIPLQTEGFPKRPRPILEIGQNFLGTGTLAKGITLPTGAVWQPYFMVFGTLRSGLQSYDNGNQLSEWANRFDVFGNLYLTFTERLLIGIRPLDRRGQFSGVTFQPESLEDGFEDQFNADITTLFFEGDFGEIFPNLDKNDGRGLDFGFSVGRQLISFQEGMLINDNIDAVGITKINWKFPSSAVNFRWTLLYAWNQLNRSNLPRDDNSASLHGLFTETDWRKSTVAFDFAYIQANDLTGDGIYAGLSSVQRLGRYNTAFRILGSFPIGEETVHNSGGFLLFNELSWTPRKSYNFVYLNSFWGIDRFTSASRDPSAGGPLGRVGISFAAVGLGRYGAALSNDASEAVGGSLGYQMFFANTRRQLILELGGRFGTDEIGQRAVAASASYQVAFGQRWVFRIDGFSSYGSERENRDENEIRFGGRLEFLTRF